MAVVGSASIVRVSERLAAITVDRSARPRVGVEAICSTTVGRGVEEVLEARPHGDRGGAVLHERLEVGG